MNLFPLAPNGSQNSCSYYDYLLGRQKSSQPRQTFKAVTTSTISKAQKLPKWERGMSKNWKKVLTYFMDAPSWEFVWRWNVALWSSRFKMHTCVTMAGTLGGWLTGSTVMHIASNIKSLFKNMFQGSSEPDWHPSFGQTFLATFHHTNVSILIHDNLW